MLIRQVLNGETPHLVPWDNWEALLKDGARLFGIRLIYLSPLLLLILPVFLMFLAFPFFSILFQHSDHQSIGMVSLLFVLGIISISLLLVPLSLAIGLIVPAAEIHVIARDEFAAGFQVKQWWPIFKKNWGGFIVVLAVMYVLLLATSVVTQIMFFTLVLICLLPFLIPAISTYYTIVQYVAFAQAYKDGQDKLSLEVAEG